MNGDVLVLGGDGRNRLLCKMLNVKGFDTEYVNTVNDLHKAIEKDHIAAVFPVPFSKDKIHIFSDNPDFRIEIDNNMLTSADFKLVIGGGFDNNTKIRFLKSGKVIFNLTENEKFKEINGIFTAQGALRLLLETENRYLKNKKVLVTGYGKIAEPLSQLLLKNGLEVWVSARKYSKLVEARKSGCNILELYRLQDSCSYFDYIFNTVPYNIFSSDTIRSFKTDSAYFELASAPFGAKKEWFEAENKRYVDGSSLPGKYLAYSSAELLCDLITEYIERQALK